MINLYFLFHNSLRDLSRIVTTIDFFLFWIYFKYVGLNLLYKFLRFSLKTYIWRFQYINKYSVWQIKVMKYIYIIISIISSNLENTNCVHDFRVFYLRLWFSVFLVWILSKNQNVLTYIIIISGNTTKSSDRLIIFFISFQTLMTFWHELFVVLEVIFSF